jgi:hypothetical protein
LLSAFALVPIFDARANVIVPFAVAFLSVGLYTVFRPGSRTARGDRLAVDGAGSTVVAALAEPGGGPEDGLALGAVSSGPTGRATAAITVTVSAGAGVAVAGEPDLASPRPRRRGRRGLHRRPRRAGRLETDQAPRSARGPARDPRFAEDDGEVGR